jgi:carbon dioxide concentrating mechanism protein CcmN
MSSPLLSDYVRSDVSISGDVTVSPEAVITSGVILRAAADSQIVIEADVCLGKGTIVHAFAGSVIIERGAILGAKVLIFGAGTIGSQACIGAEATIINPEITAKTVIATGALVGDESRQIDETLKPDDEDFWATSEPTATETLDFSGFVAKVESGVGSADAASQIEPSVESVVFVESKPEGEETEATTEVKIEAHQGTNNVIVGKLYVNQLLVKLFPHRQDDRNELNGNNSSS